jgi:adenylate kinase
MKRNLVFLGAPGAGKGTLAAILAKEKGIAHISTGEIFRREIRAETDLGKKAKQFVETGKLVPDEIVAAMVGKRLAEEDCRSGFILDGFPRTVPQAELLSKELETRRLALEAVVLFVAGDDLLIRRLTARFMCKSCNALYNRLFSPPRKEGVCDQCGSGEFYQRDDDKLETAKERLQIYEEQTAPLIEYYEATGLLARIDAEKDADIAYPELLGVLR